jgi:hypothetical protein
MMVAMVILLAGSTGMAQDGVSAGKKAQAKLLAQRAARADAMRKLAERIKGLQITSETSVKDFVAENDEIQTAMDAWLIGMKEEGDYKHYEDGTCTIEMSVTLRTVITELEHLHKTYYKGDKIQIQDIQNMTQTVQLDKITVTGEGAAPELEMLMDPPLQPVAEGQTLSLPDYWKQHVTGRGRLMALRAARVDAMRRLAERIKGIRISSETYVKDFVAESDEINTQLNASLQGAKELGERYHEDELIVEVEMMVALRTVLTSVKSSADVHYTGDKANIVALQEYIESIRVDEIRETGMGVPPEKYLKDYQGPSITTLNTISNVPWATETKVVTGNAALDDGNTNAAQAKLMAFRAAELDARRKLSEELGGLMITSETSVQDFVAEHDEIRTKMLSYQIGASVVDGSQTVLSDGTAQVQVQIELKPLWNMVVFYMKQYPVR